MVKVKDEAGMAEPKSASVSTAPTPGRKSRHYQNHTHHHPPFHHFHHYHHWTYPTESVSAVAAGEANGSGGSAANGAGGGGSAPATIHFGPGFELQQQVPTRYGAGPSGAQANPNPEHVVHFHVNPGVTISFQIGDNMEVIRGPVTVPMVSTNSSPPIAMPVQVPPGHVVQQIVDESGTLRHVILSPQPPPLVPLPSHNPQHYGPGNGTNQQQTFYSQGLPPGYPQPHYHSNIPPGHPAHITPLSNPGNSPPPNHGYYKDERTQRQYMKLKRKLETKQRSDGLGSGQNTPVLSPRKELVNGLRRGAAKEKGMSSVGTSEDGEESSSVQDEDDDVHIITDMLSSVQSPRVSELSSRSALLQWAAPLRLSEASSSDSHEIDVAEADLRYEVLLSDKSKEMKYKSIYSGASLSCRIQDLRPGQEYSVCLQVHLDELQGSASDPIKFTTPACEPDQPQPPKLLSRTKTTLQLRWNAAADNGSHIQYYILEYDNGKDSGFVELHKSRGKQHSLSKLQPATTYKFRLAAVNECGKSAFSDVVAYSTSDNAPQQPNPPGLKESTVRSLHLSWQRRPKDEEFILQMDDQKTGYGYLVIYNGKETDYICGNLKRYTEYKFRLKAQNEGGQSGWSEEVTYKTLPDRPSQPARPSVKGRIHAHSFKLKWDSPSDKGGAEITTYNLEINCGTGYETVYTGSETEAVCDKLNPGTTYQSRVSCVSAGGVSNYSDPCTVTTEAICPGQCALPRLNGKPRANSVTIKWIGPDYNGGAPVSEYEVEQLNPDSNRQIAYRGKETECTISSLLPGQDYVFTVRAVNRIGPGPWSEELRVTSGAAPPDAPNEPETNPKSPFNIFVEWAEPPTNGASITEYKLEMSTSDNNNPDQFMPVYTGASTSYDMKGLTPFTPYYFRVQATNSAGNSPYSVVAKHATPPAAPSAVSSVRTEATPTSLTLSWTEPLNNGSDILHYTIEIADRIRTTDGPVTEYTIESLKPETFYKIKIQAVNKVGAGAHSPAVKCCTLPLPPAAPRLECIGVGHNYLKLKWGDGKNVDFTQYCVEMDNVKMKEFQCVYQGTSYTCKVNKLQELTNYRFRISAANDAGEGDYSDVYEFMTCIAPPAGLKTVRVVEVEQRSCSLEWNPAKCNITDPIVYVVQLTRIRDQDYKQLYRGAESKCTLDNLEAGAEYCARVCPVRQAPSGDLAGPYSTPLTFVTLCQDPVTSAKQLVPSSTGSPTRNRRSHSLIAWIKGSPEKKPMSDTQWAVLLLLIFGAVSIFAAMCIETFINWGKSV